MASLITVSLNKGGSPSLGFRLQGGKDFGTPLVVQKVNGGSPAERAGLIAGDSVIKINNVDVFNLRHKDAQDVIIRAGPAFEVTVQRGGSTWKPSVTPTGSFPAAQTPIHNISPVTKTSLASRQHENIGAIGTGHNLSAKPFSPQLNGTVNGGPKLVNNQYNSPLKLYSEESIAETLSAQTEVLSTGALGVNFKKNEKNYDASKSAVFHMLQEAEKEPRTPEAVSPTTFYATQSHAIGGGRQVASPRSNTESNAPLQSQQQNPNNNDQEGVTKCTDCERVIVGVFVRIKDKNLHVECFKCSTCGTSLKNVGYYNINNKLYCDVHAKLAARNNPPAPNLVPVTVPPGGKVPASAISAALSSHSLPSPSPLSPRSNFTAQPFQSGNFSGPKPFSSVSAPSPNYNTLPRAAPISPIASAPIAPSSYSPASSAESRSVSNIVWPPLPEEPEVPTACPLYFPPPSQVKLPPKKVKVEEECNEEVEEIYMAQPKMSICSEEVYGITERKSAVECVETISESLQTQQLVESVLKMRPPSPPPVDRDIVVSEVKKQETEVREVKQEFKEISKESLTEICSRESCELKRPIEFSPNTMECRLKSPIENAVPQKWESSMVQALRTIPDPFTEIPTKRSSSALASALAIAPSEPFTPHPDSLKPVPLPEETEPYFPPEHPIEIEPKEAKPDKNDSQFVSALKTAPERPFTPVGGPRKKKDPTAEYLKDLPKPQQRLTMRDALTVASDRPYTPLIFENMKMEENKQKVEKVKREDLQRPLKPATLPASFEKHEEKIQVPRCYPVVATKVEEVQEASQEVSGMQEVKSTQIVEESSGGGSGELPLFKGFSCSFENKNEHSQFKIEICTTPPRASPVVVKKVTEEHEETRTEEKKVEKQRIERQKEDVILKKPLPLAAALHKPEALPQYQVSLSENAEADLQLMEKVKAAQIRHEQQKVVEVQKKPVIMIQPGDVQPQETLFKPVVESRPQSSTFSPRPRALTPSMINKPPPVLPYYQANLVAQPHRAVSATLLDPRSPAVSRSPSPCPERDPSRGPSPFPSSGAARAVSPAPGPPPNPLSSHQPLPTPRDSKIEEAKKLVTSYIPQYQSKVELIERAQEIVQGLEEKAQERITHEERNVQEDASKQSKMMQSKRLEEEARAQVLYQQTANESSKTSIQEQSRHLEELNKSEMKSVERHGATQVQRKKTVTEEFERNTKMVQVEKSTVKNYPFRDVKNPVVDEQHGIIGLHVTNPQPISSPFLKGEVKGHVCLPEKPCQSGNVCQKPCQPDQCCKLAPTRPKEANPTACPRNSPAVERPPQVAPIKHVPAPSPTCPIKHVTAPSGSAQKPSLGKPNVDKSNVPIPNAGSGGGRQAGACAVAPRRGRGVLNTAALGGTRVPLCGSCHSQIRGPFITALGKIWCPDHFICATPSCRRPLQDLGFVEERGQLYCEYCFEQYLAPNCSKCNSKIKGDCLKAIGKNFHPECFNCVYCGKLFANSPFFLEDGSPYCEADWNELFTTKCYACGFPVEAGDRWVEALNNNYHSQCFNCTMCKKNLEGQSFFAKGGRPFCKNHAR